MLAKRRLDNVIRCGYQNDVIHTGHTDQEALYIKVVGDRGAIKGSREKHAANGNKATLRSIYSRVNRHRKKSIPML
jgi:hypothetical protein